MFYQLMFETNVFICKIRIRFLNQSTRCWVKTEMRVVGQEGIGTSPSKASSNLQIDFRTIGRAQMMRFVSRFRFFNEFRRPQDIAQRATGNKKLSFIDVNVTSWAIFCNLGCIDFLGLGMTIELRGGHGYLLSLAHRANSSTCQEADVCMWPGPLCTTPR